MSFWKNSVCPRCHRVSISSKCHDAVDAPLTRKEPYRGPHPVRGLSRPPRPEAAAGVVYSPYRSRPNSRPWGKCPSHVGANYDTMPQFANRADKTRFRGMLYVDIQKLAAASPSRLVSWCAKGKNKMKETTERKYLSRKQVATYLNVSSRKVDQWIKDGRLPAVRADRRILVDRTDADAFFSSLKQPTLAS
jgi:excisionase family DNA binding protein